MTTENNTTPTTKRLDTAARKDSNMTVDPRQRILRRVEDRLSSQAGKRVRVGCEADRLILSIRDEILSRTYQNDKRAIMELQVLLEEGLTEFDEFRKTVA